MKVKAIRPGMHGGILRRAGETFDYTGPTEKMAGGKKVSYFPSWLENLEPKSKRGPKPAAKADADSKDDGKTDADDTGDGKAE